MAGTSMSVEQSARVDRMFDTARVNQARCSDRVISREALIALRERIKRLISDGVPAMFWDVSLVGPAGDRVRLFFDGAILTETGQSNEWHLRYGYQGGRKPIDVTITLPAQKDFLQEVCHQK